MPRRPIVEDLAQVPGGATFLATRGTAKHLERIGELDRLEAVWANPASPELFRACARAPSLRALYVTHFKRMSDVPLAGAPRLEHLLLSWAPKLADLSFLSELPALRTLYLDSMKRIDLETLPHLPRLRGLYLGGGMWETLKVDSLTPLARLPGLRALRFANARPVDGSLRTLAQLPELRDLHLPNFFEVEEVARLATALPKVTSNTLGPVFDPYPGNPESASAFPCPKCQGPRQMMTGRPSQILCPECDAPKYRRRIARWESALGTRWPAE